MDYIENNFGRYDLSLNEIADQFQMNRSYLSTLFRTKTGQNYVDYLTRLRMARAHTLIIETELPILEIMRMVGYTDTAYFRRRFREVYQTSPSDLRRSK